MALSIGRAFRRLATLGALITVLASVRAEAQAPSNPASSAPVHVGPVGFSPVLSLASGVDTNVLADPETPSQDLVTTLSINSGSWLRLGALRVSATGALDYLNFRRYTDQGGLNGNGTVRVELPRNRLTPYVAGTFSNIKQRSLDIDQRVRTTQSSVAAGTGLRVGGRTSIDVSARLSDFDFGDTAFGGVALNQTLARRSESLVTTIRQGVTPLSGLLVQGEANRDRFKADPQRDTNGLRLMVGFESEARINGKALVGYRWFRPENAAVPSFEGVVGSGELSYVMLHATRFTLGFERDVSYSFEPVQPYFVLTSGRVEVTQAVTRALGLAARVSAQRNDYRLVTGVDQVARTDSNLAYGGGVTYQLGYSVRLLGYVDYFSRTSSSFSDFDGLRYGTSVSYTF